MPQHAILEIDDRALTLALGQRERGRITVHSCRRIFLRDGERERSEEAVRRQLADLLDEVEGVHVIVGDRRLQHFLIEVPEMSAAELGDAVRGEAMHRTSVADPNDVLVTARFVCRLPGRRVLLAGAALPREVWDTLNATFDALGCPVLGLYSLEECLALAVPAGEASVAVLEHSAARARFVLCEHGAVAQVRRFLIGGKDQAEPGSIVEQLAYEVPRTLAWLHELGHATPDLLVLGNRVDLRDADPDAIRGEIPRIAPAALAVDLPGFGAIPGLASQGLMGALCVRRRVPSLLHPTPIRLPWTLPQTAALAASIVVAGFSAGLIPNHWRKWSAARTELATVAAERRELAEANAAAELQRMAARRADRNVQTLAQALGQRRPASLVCAEVSKAVPATMRLDELRFSSAELVVGGFVAGDSPAAAQATLAEFAQRVGALSYVAPRGGGEVEAVDGVRNTFRFRLGLTWRDS